MSNTLIRELTLRTVTGNTQFRFSITTCAGDSEATAGWSLEKQVNEKWEKVSTGTIYSSPLVSHVTPFGGDPSKDMVADLLATVLGGELLLLRLGSMKDEIQNSTDWALSELDRLIKSGDVTASEYGKSELTHVVTEGYNNLNNVHVD